MLTAEVSTSVFQAHWGDAPPSSPSGWSTPPVHGDGLRLSPVGGRGAGVLSSV